MDLETEPSPIRVRAVLHPPEKHESEEFETHGAAETPDAKGGGKIKLSLEVTPEVNRVLERIATATGATKTEAMRKAIALMHVAVEAMENGERLFVAKTPPPGASREIVGL